MIANKQLKLYRVLSNSKIFYSILTYMQNEDIINLACSGRLLNLAISQNKVLINNATLKAKKNLAEVIYLKENQCDIHNTEKLSQIYEESDEIYSLFYKASNKLMKIFVYQAILLAIDTFSLTIAFKFESFYHLDWETMWICLTPLTGSWVVSIIIYLALRNQRNTREKRINIIIESVTKDLRYFNNKKTELKEKLSLRMKCKQNVLFEKFLISYILFYFPIFTRYHFFKSRSNEVTFLISAILIFSSMYFSDLITFIKYKCNSTNKLKGYQRIFNDDLLFLDKVQAIQHRVISSQCSEKEMNILFFGVKLFLYLMFIFYCGAVGDKLDGKENLSWLYLFVPIYVIQFPALVYAFMHCYEMTRKVKYKLFILITTGIVAMSLMVNSVLIPMILEKMIKVSAFVVPLNFFLCSIALYIHHILISNQISD